MSWLTNCVRTYHTVLADIKAFLHRQRWKEALIFSCFVLLSFGFWLLQSLQQEYETVMSIPLRYNNVPEDIIFTNKVPQEISIRIKDKGSALLNYMIGQKFRSITIDMTGALQHRATIVYPSIRHERKPGVSGCLRRKHTNRKRIPRIFRHTNIAIACNSLRQRFHTQLD